VHEPGVLPWIFRLTVGPDFPTELVEVAELLALRQAASCFPEAVLDPLAVPPLDPGRDGVERDELRPVRHLGAFLTLGPSPVRELEQCAAQDALAVLGRGISPAVIGGHD
jgi:hypothetical protein